MSAKFIETALPGVIIIEPAVHKDSRGFFLETFHHRKYAESCIDNHFVQDNHSHSKQGTLRGLHYQLRHPQGKLIFVVSGEIFDVAVDIRRGSPAFGKWVGITLSAENKRQMYVPEGFAHGFCTLSESADVMYKCTDFYYSEDDYGVLWSDATIKIEWPVKKPILSPKDDKFQNLSDIPETNLPVYSA